VKPKRDDGTDGKILQNHRVRFFLKIENQIRIPTVLPGGIAAKRARSSLSFRRNQTKPAFVLENDPINRLTSNDISACWRAGAFTTDASQKAH
jgi:hypothetical protein